MDFTGVPSLSVVFAGHTNTGKSTLLGHLIHLLGGFSERQIESLRNQARDWGRRGFHYAWISDTTRLEREIGITIFGKCKEIIGTNSIISIWDAPGNYIKNTLTCIVQSDMMVLCVAANEKNEFFNSLNPDYGTFKNVLISSLNLGIKQVIVAVNKMDSIIYSEERFVAVEQKLSKMMMKIGWKSGSFSFIPVSAWHGDNLIKASVKMPWWKGKTFVQALYDLPIPERLNDNYPLRFMINESYLIKGAGIVITGRVLSGTIKPSQVITVGTSIPYSITVNSIEQHSQRLSYASSGMSVGVNIKDQLNYQSFKRGMIVGDASNHPPRYCSSFSAEVYIVNHPGKLAVGYVPIIDCGTAHVACRMSSITCLLSKTKEVLEESPKFIKKGDFACVIFEPTKPLFVEEYSKFPDVLGRIIIREGPMIVGVGKVVGVDTKENKSVGILTKAAVRKN